MLTLRPPSFKSTGIGIVASAARLSLSTNRSLTVPFERWLNTRSLTRILHTEADDSFPRNHTPNLCHLASFPSYRQALHSRGPILDLNPKGEEDRIENDDMVGHMDHEKSLRFDLAVAHRIPAKFNMDMLVWNHISARFDGGCLITPGRKLWSCIKPADLVFRSENVTADIIHQAIYEARIDIQAIIHLHTPAATAVSCLQDGFVPLTQDAAYFYKKVAHYEWDGLSNDAAEGPAITAAIRSLPGCNTLLMQNHGFACFGTSVQEAWMLAYYFERVCDVQLRVMSSGAKIKFPPPAVMEKAAETSYLPDFAPGVCEWDAICDEVGASFEHDDDASEQ